MKSMKISEERKELVVKSNDFLRRTRYELSTIEQKLLIYLISRVKRDDIELKSVQMNIAEYLKICGENTGGKNYEYVKASLKKLRDKSWWIKDGKREILFSWVDTAMIDERNHTVTIRLSECLKPYIIDLKENFTKYQLINVLVLKSKYSVRLYELLKSYEWMGHWTISTAELRDLLQVSDKYTLFQNFKVRVLLPAITEINELTDLIITWEPVKEGRNIAEIKFKIREKRGFEEFIQYQENLEKRLK